MSEVPNKDWLGLTGKVVAITGAAGGIGEAIAAAFAEVGARVALLDRDEAAVAIIAARLVADGGEAIALGCDVSDEASVDAAADRVAEAFGPADVLVNNAAILLPGAIFDISIAEWNRLLSINLTGYLLCARSFGRQMKAKGGGAMVHTGSVSGRVPQAFSGAYSVAKAGAHMLSQLIAVEMGEYGIRSNVVSPTMVLTPMSEGFYKDPDIRARREQMVPLRRIGMPADIAQAILWLASPRSDYVNGIDMPVDGGMPNNLLSFIPRPGFDRKDQ